MTTTPDPTSVTSDYRFAPVPEEVLYDTSLGHLAIRVYACLLRHGLTPDTCYPSHARIAGLLGVSKRSIQRPMGELQTAGWVIAHTRFDGAGMRMSDAFEVRTVRAQERGARAGERATHAEERGPTTQDSADRPRSGARAEREPLNESHSMTQTLLQEPNPRVRAAFELIGQWRFRDRQGPLVIDRKAWKAKVAGEVWREHAAKARALLAQDPDLTPEQLASRLEGSPSVTVKPYKDPEWDKEAPVPPEVAYGCLNEARAVVGR